VEQGPPTVLVKTDDGGYSSSCEVTVPDDLFRGSWNTAYSTEATKKQITLPLVATGTYDFTVDWGDGGSNTIAAWDDANKTHTYAATGTYRVRIRAQAKGWRFGGAANHYQSCENLGITAADITSIAARDTAGVSNLGGTFGEMSLFTRATARNSARRGVPADPRQQGLDNHRGRAGAMTGPVAPSAGGSSRSRPFFGGPPG
jgi:hypothetical protein